MRLLTAFLVLATAATALSAAAPAAVCIGSGDTPQAPKSQQLGFCRQHRKSTCCSASSERSVIKAAEPFFAESRAVLLSAPTDPALLPPLATLFTSPFPATAAPDAPTEVEVFRYSIPAACRAYAASLLCARCSADVGTGRVAGVCVRSCQQWHDACADVLFRPDPDVPGALLPCAEQSYARLSAASAESAADADASAPVFIPVASEQAALEAKALASALTIDDTPAVRAALAAALAAAAGSAPAAPLVCAPLRTLVATGPALCAAYGVEVADPLDSSADENAFARAVLALYAGYRALPPALLTSAAGDALRAAARRAVAGADVSSLDSAAAALTAPAADALRLTREAFEGHRWATRSANAVTGDEAAALLPAAGLLSWTADDSAADSETTGRLIGMSAESASAVLAVLRPALALPLLPPLGISAPASTARPGSWLPVARAIGAAGAAASASGAARHGLIVSTTAMLRDIAAVSEAFNANAAVSSGGAWDWTLPRQQQCWDAATADSALNDWLVARARNPAVQPATALLSLAGFKSYQATKAVQAAQAAAAARENAPLELSWDLFSWHALSRAFTRLSRTGLRQVRAGVQYSSILPRSVRTALLDALLGPWRFAIANAATAAFLALLMLFTVMVLRSIFGYIARKASAAAAAVAEARAPYVPPVLLSSVATVAGNVLGGDDSHSPGARTAESQADVMRAARMAFLAAQQRAAEPVPAAREAAQSQQQQEPEAQELGSAPTYFAVPEPVSSASEPVSSGSTVDAAEAPVAAPAQSTHESALGDEE